MYHGEVSYIVGQNPCTEKYVWEYPDRDDEAGPSKPYSLLKRQVKNILMPTMLERRFTVYKQ
jgi:hypothetical protein